jgi:hypothetical protein
VVAGTNYTDYIENTNTSALTIACAGVLLTLESGTVKASAGGFLGPGNNLTNLNASALASGTVPQARLGTNSASENYVLSATGGDTKWVAQGSGSGDAVLGANQTWTGINQFSNTTFLSTAVVSNLVARTNLYFGSLAGAYLTSDTGSGALVTSGPFHSSGDISIGANYDIFGGGAGLTNLNGASIQASTIASNALGATAIEFIQAAAGTGSGDATLGGTNTWTGTNTFEGPVIMSGGLTITGGTDTTSLSNLAVGGWLSVGGNQTNSGTLAASSFSGDGSALTSTNKTLWLATNGAVAIKTTAGDTLLNATFDDGVSALSLSASDVEASSLSVLGGIAVGGGIAGDGAGITNLNGAYVGYATNLSTMAPDFSLPYSTITTNDAFTFLAPLNVSATLAQTAVILVTNSTATVKVVRPPANVHTNGVWNVTNMTTFTFFNYGGVITNAIAFPLW